MTTDILIWAIFGVACLATAANLALASTNASIYDAARAEVKAAGARGVPIGCLMAILGWVSVGLWTWYAFVVADWRFAGIVWIPVVGNIIVKVAGKQAKR